MLEFLLCQLASSCWPPHSLSQGLLLASLPNSGCVSCATNPFHPELGGLQKWVRSTRHKLSHATFPAHFDIGLPWSDQRVSMEAAAKTSTASRRRKNHGHHGSKHRSLLDGERLDTTATSQQVPTSNPGVDELRRVRTEFYKKSSEERRRETPPEMNPFTSPTRHSKSRRSSTKIPDIATREVRRDHESRHRSRREKHKEEPQDDTGYVYKQVYDNPSDGDYAKPVLRRRASAPRSTSRSELERLRNFEPNLARRLAERRAKIRDAGGESSGTQRRSDHHATTPRSAMSRYEVAVVNDWARSVPANAFFLKKRFHAREIFDTGLTASSFSK